MNMPIVRLVAWLLATLPVLLILGGTLHYTDCRLVGLCFGLALEAVIATLAIRGIPRWSTSLGVCLLTSLIGWASLTLIVVMCPPVGTQALLPLKLFAAAVNELFCK